MAGVAIETQGLDLAIGTLIGLSRADYVDLTFQVGQFLEGSTKARFADEESPDGDPWADWSPDYAASRHRGQSLLQAEGDLLDSVANRSQGTVARVGTPLIYGAIHQFGGDEVEINIPARPYLGVSDDDEAEIRELVTGEWRGLLA
ncbi:phage virion morphogenesis protein [Pseudaestuariivita sp.]|uniref:phage virion morphogenesis protein n=1 Tax=Pseudaestuariivita sp. TaxID=2211669 RepID=UPI0040590A3E